MKRVIALMVILAMMTGLLCGCGSGGTYDAKVHNKLIKHLKASDYEKANKLMQKDDGYKITDKDQALEVLRTIDEGQEGNKLSIYYFLPVIDAIDCADKTVSYQMDQQLYKAGMKWFKSDFELDKVRDMWSRCSEGSLGYAFLVGFEGILEGDPIAGARTLKEHVDLKEDAYEVLQSKYKQHLEKKEYTDVQTYMNDMIAVGILFGDDHASDLSEFKLPSYECMPHSRLHEKNYGDIYAYAAILGYEELSGNLPGALKNADGNKLLVLDRVAIAGTGEVKLGIDSYMMRSLPEKFLPETLQEVGYVMLIDYGLEQDGIWYAGNATVTLYDVKTGTELYTSETLKGEYDQFYVGKSTNVIFGTYPDVTDMVKNAVSTIN